VITLQQTLPVCLFIVFFLCFRRLANTKGEIRVGVSHQVKNEHSSISLPVIITFSAGGQLVFTGGKLF